jgi:hypothetical protein
MTKHVILFLAAEPRGYAVLRLGDECAEIQREVSTTRYRDDFRFESRWAVGIDGLIRYLGDLEPAVIHVSGHGGGRAGLMLQDERGQPQAVSGQALARIVDAAARNVRVVVLNACYSAEQAEILRRRIDCVVGMTGAIGDDAARVFAIQFYAALGDRRSVGNAVERGVAALSARQLPDDMFPRCVTRDGVDANRVLLGAPAPPRASDAEAPGPPGRRWRNAFAPGVAAGIAVAIPPAVWGSPAGTDRAAREPERPRDPSAARRAPDREAGDQAVTRSAEATRAVQYQHAVLTEFGQAVTEDELVQEAIDNHLYMSSTGMRVEDIGRQLEAHGLEVHYERNAHAFHLATELAQGHKVLIGVDGHGLWGDHPVRDSIARELGFGAGGHAVLLCSIDTTDPAHPEVVVANPHTGAIATHYPLPAFVEAWRGSCFSLVATAEPCPGHLPEMVNFDYRTGHLPMIGEVPYEVAHACCAASAHETSAHAAGDLESWFLGAVDGHGIDGPAHGLATAMLEPHDAMHDDLDHPGVDAAGDPDLHGDRHDDPIDPDHHS